LQAVIQVYPFQLLHHPSVICFPRSHHFTSQKLLA
jgi:hypothetical protein